MKKYLMVFLMISGGFALQAQDEVETYTDEELTTYATVMVWAEDQKAVMSEQLVERIKSDSVLQGKYNDLKDAYGDDAKLEEIGATEEEVAAYEAIIAYEDSIKSAFKETYIEKIKSDITVGLYNRLKKSLKSDEDVKARYEAIVATLKDESTEESTEESQDTDDSAG